MVNRACLCFAVYFQLLACTALTATLCTLDGTSSRTQSCSTGEAAPASVLLQRYTRDSPTKAYVKAASAENCPSGQEVATARECETAGAAVGHPFEREVLNKHKRLAGCFWDENTGKSYFNTHLEASVENGFGWTSVGAICLAEAPAEADNENWTCPSPDGDMPPDATGNFSESCNALQDSVNQTGSIAKLEVIQRMCEKGSQEHDACFGKLQRYFTRCNVSDNIKNELEVTLQGVCNTTELVSSSSILPHIVKAVAPTEPTEPTDPTEITCWKGRCTVVDVRYDWTVVLCRGKDACKDATIRQKNNAKHVLIYCKGEAACKGSNGILDNVAGDDWTVWCYEGNNVCDDWTIESSGAAKCSGGNCPTWEERFRRWQHIWREE